jgi:XTP/dITP diphosphohydrolase
MTFLIATRNRHKVHEIQSILPGSHRFLSLADFARAPEIAEDAGTFAGNALKKASALADWLRSNPETPMGWSTKGPTFVLADDSGLEVDALQGAPGVHSARFAALDNPSRASNSTDAENNTKLLHLLQSVPQASRRARFRCVLALVPADVSPGCSAPRLFEGVCEGHISLAPKGQGGFGYDPLFIPLGHKQTFAELGTDLKNRLSHRSLALGKLKTYLEALAAGQLGD